MLFVFFKVKLMRSTRNNEVKVSLTGSVIFKIFESTEVKRSINLIKNISDKFPKEDEEHRIT